MNRFLLGFIILTLMSPTLASAYEVIDPMVLCDRFISGPEQQKCMKFVKQKKPDTYVSSVCHYLFDDKIFDDCLKLAIRISANPRALSKCSASELSDKDRMLCLKRSQFAGSRFQSLPTRLPATATEEVKAGK